MVKAFDDSPSLSQEWSETAIQAARNLGLDAPPSTISAEHWQRVLASVEARMRMRGIEAPSGWRDTLAMRFGRDGGAHADPEG